MSRLHVLTLFIGLHLNGLSQRPPVAQFGLYTAVDFPLASTMPYMSPNLGIGILGARRLTPDLPIYLELKGSLGRYHQAQSSESFFLTQGVTTQINVRYRSNLNHLRMGTKVYFTPMRYKVKGFITPQFGHSFFRTVIRFAEPEPEDMEMDECAPVHRDVKHRSSLWTYGGEIGLEVNLRSVDNYEKEGDGRFFFSVSYLGSFRNAEYVNVKYMKSEPNGPYNHNHQHNADQPGRPLTAEFINLSTNMTHDHKIAEIYTSPLHLLTFNIGFKINF